MGKDNGWQQCETRVFWGSVAPNDHVVQIYDNEAMLLATLADFASDGFIANNSVIIIATGSHLEQLNNIFNSRGFDTDTIIASDQYIALDADKTLSKFMVNGWPDEKYFIDMATALIKKAGKNNRQVRAFGEMVALLWERGNSSAAIKLEELWNKVLTLEPFCLFCAYPKNSFTNDASASIMHVCKAHSRLINGDEELSSLVKYKDAV